MHQNNPDAQRPQDRQIQQHIRKIFRGGHLAIHCNHKCALPEPGHILQDLAQIRYVHSLKHEVLPHRTRRTQWKIAALRKSSGVGHDEQTNKTHACKLCLLASTAGLQGDWARKDRKRRESLGAIL
jgi:hypothetical protein